VLYELAYCRRIKLEIVEVLLAISLEHLYPGDKPEVTSIIVELTFYFDAHGQSIVIN
jgi:hypothetical protein